MKSQSQHFVHAADLDNPVQAQIIHSMLEENNIPHRIVSREDPAYAGIFQLQYGWGFIESPEPHKNTVRQTLQELNESNKHNNQP